MTKIRYSRLFNIAYPIILGNLAQTLLTVTDTAFLGHLDAVALGAAALGGVAYLAFMMFGYGFGIGLQIIIARRVGENRSAEVGTESQHSLYITLPIALICWLIGYLFADNLLTVAIQSPDVLHSTTSFLRARLYGIPFGFMLYLFQAFFVGIARTKIITLASCVMVSVNILLDYLMIFGKAGLSPMGIEGAAWASAISEVVGVIFYFIYITKTPAFTPYRLFLKHPFSWGRITNLFKVSGPAALQNFLSIGSWFLFFAMVEKLGELAIGVANICRSLYSIYLLPMWGIFSAVSSLVSYAIGCKRPNLTFPIITKATLLGSAMILALILLSLLIDDTIINLYTNLPDVASCTKSVMLSVGISAMGFGLGYFAFAAVLGTGNTTVGLIIEILATCIYVYIAIQSVNSWGWDIQKALLIDGIYGMFIGICSWLYLLLFNWQKRTV